MTDLVPRLLLGDLDLTDYPYSLEFGADLGAPENLYDVLLSQIADGELVSSRRSSNRSLSFVIAVEGADMIDLAESEAALIAECERPANTLTFDPGDGVGSATVFDTFRAQVSAAHDDNGEIALLRRYAVTIPALPFGRSETPTTIGSEFVPDSESIADDCESTTGWSVYGSGESATITVDSTAGHFSTGTGAVKFVTEPYIWDVTALPANGAATISAKVRKTGLSIDASGGGYFVFRHRPEPGWSLDTTSPNIFYLTTSGGGREVATLVSMTAEENGYTKYALAVPDLSTITTFEVETVMSRPGPKGSLFPHPSQWFDSIGLAAGATENQAARTLDVGGSVRSEGSFAISGAAGLGSVALYTAPDLGDGLRPDLRRWQSAGTSTADGSAINGTYVPANTGVFEAPTTMFRAGDYVLLARVRSTGGTSFTLEVDAQTVLDSTAIGQVYSTGGTLAVPNTTDYHLVRVGVLGLPPHRVDAAADAVVRFTLSGTSTCRVDELLAFPLEDAALTWVECGSGTPSATVASRVWIDAPSADLPYGQILVGTEADRSDARYVLPEAKGRHMLYPGRMLAYLLTSAAGGADLATTYYKRWHTWAAEAE